MSPTETVEQNAMTVVPPMAEPTMDEILTALAGEGTWLAPVGTKAKPESKGQEAPAEKTKSSTRLTLVKKEGPAKSNEEMLAEAADNNYVGTKLSTILCVTNTTFEEFQAYKEKRHAGTKAPVETPAPLPEFDDSADVDLS